MRVGLTPALGYEKNQTKEKEMENEMPLPRYYGLVRLVAQIGAALGCLAGLMQIVSSFSAFKFGFMAGASVLFSGVLTIIGALAVLGVAYCFLAIVKAQIESRNAIVSYISANKLAKD